MADEGRLIGFQGKLRHLPPQGQGCRRSGPEVMGSQSGEAILIIGGKGLNMRCTFILAARGAMGLILAWLCL
jgi:hypothetical protein